jgi:2-dehydro-3-deoxygluconokinase
MTRVVCIGECMVELRALGADTFGRSYAGDAFNTAVYLKRCVSGARVQFLTATGSGSLNQSMRAAWRAHGIDEELAFVAGDGPPGLYLIETDAHGERTFQYWRSHSCARQWLTQLHRRGESLLWNADIVYLSGISLAILTEDDQVRVVELLERLKGHVGHIAFDPNIRASLWPSRDAAATMLTAVMARCDIVLPSTEDMGWLLGISDPEAQLDSLQAQGIREIAMTLGAGGCLVANGGGRTHVPSPLVARVVDTSGAGDSFNGEYLGRRLGGSTPVEAARAALRIAARVVSQAGAIIPAAVTDLPLQDIE